MIQFKALIEKFGQQGEKTGWTYFLIPAAIAEKINKGVRTSYRVKGFLDETEISGVAVLPMGEGDFIMPLNGELRKKIHKKKNDELLVRLSVDKSEYQLNEGLMACMADAKEAYDRFMALPRSHQNYYSKWVETAKTEVTKAKRIACVIKGMLLNQTFAEMLKSGREDR
jgi:hypothetical protein